MPSQNAGNSNVRHHCCHPAPPLGARTHRAGRGTGRSARCRRRPVPPRSATSTARGRPGTCVARGVVVQERCRATVASRRTRWAARLVLGRSNRRDDNVVRSEAPRDSGPAPHNGQQQQPPQLNLSGGAAACLSQVGNDGHGGGWRWVGTCGTGGRDRMDRIRSQG